MTFELMLGFIAPESVELVIRRLALGIMLAMTAITLLTRSKPLTLLISHRESQNMD